MTKRIFSLLMVIAILMAMLVMPVSGSEIPGETESDTTELTEACPCGCGVSLAQVAWRVYDPNTAGGVTSGHYYLDGDYVQSTQFTINATASVVLDLRGYTLTSKSYKRLYLINGYMAVMDTVGGGVISSKTGGDGYGGVIMMSYEDTDSGNKPVFELYSGILTADADNKGGLRGGLVSVGSKSTFRMYGGIVMNGSAEAKTEQAGGCIAATTSSATICIEGGTVMGGRASGHGGNLYSNGGTTVLRNCRILGGVSTLNGGNIYQTGGTLTIENCLIADGSASGSYGGGNICAQSSAVVTVRNTTIRNGYAAKQGGNLYFATGNQLLENVTLSAGVAGTYGGNLRMTSNAVTTMDNCTVSGDVSVSGSLTLKGATKIGLNNNGLNLIYSGNTKAVKAADLTEGAEVYVNAGALFTDSGAKAEYFKPALRTVITQSAEGLVGTQAVDGEIAGFCPHCGEQVSWQAFDTNACLVKECLLDGTGDTDSACTGRHMASGHYYLTQTYTSFSQMYSGASADGKTMSADVVVDLSGFSITAGGRAFYIKPTTPASTLSLLDSVGGSVVTCKGTAGQGGGMVYSEKGNLNIYGGKYVYATGKEISAGGLIYSGLETHIYGGIFDASAYSRTDYNGGVVQMSTGVNKKLTVTAGHFTGGTAKNGGVLYVGGNVGVNITGGQFRGGSAAEAGGNLYFGGVVKLHNGFINNGKAEERGQDICMVQGSRQTVLAVGEESTGTVSMYIAESLMGTPVYGSTVAGTVATTLNMVITLEGDYGQPRLCASGGALAVSAASVEGDGSKWYATAAEAAAACEEGQFIKLFADADLELTKDCTVDLGGNTLTLTGSGTLYGMDSSGDGLALPTGKVIGNVQISEYCRSADNRIYVAAAENGETTFHRLDMRITGAALRPSVSGIYYTGKWGYDEVLAGKLKSGGVAVSTVAMPGMDFMEENSGSLWTSFDAAAMTSGENKTGAIISGILSEDATAQLNDAYGKMPIFATAYVTLESGTVITSDDPGNHNDIGYSVYGLMQQLEALAEADPNAYSRYLLPARDFYKTWKDSGMGDWEFSKIPGKADNGKLDILFIGNSYTWYGKCVLDKGQNALSLANRTNDQGYFYQVCKANGIDANVTNFTFGGHMLSDWYTGNCQADRGHNGLDHMAYLTDRDYDYVVLQQGTAGAGYADILAQCQPLMDIFRQVNPDTKFVFLVHHQAHLNQHSYLPNLDTLEDAGFIVVDWGALVADVINGTTQVPGATQTYNKNSFVIRKSASDGYHENMLTGYITAQMLYCALTGENAVGQDYSFCGDKTINKAFDFEKFLKEEYSYDNATSNFIEIFNSPSDMLGLQQLIDQYLAAKGYRDY